eukprot:TRINITY_DN4563_c0_g1_i8.p1 TRINITY_DN4563_c0_g1~~TRINITY_DN4563_c0_g1_i8.p1  ORF type:complete len:366 (+),score=44.02 TRINITY_DN4563_c0_g1_i8:115-1098(+)
MDGTFLADSRLSIDSRMLLLEDRIHNLNTKIKGSENDLLQISSTLSVIDYRLSAKSYIAPKPIQEPETYVTMIPGRGPNNQYLGLKDLLYISKTIGRTVGLPSFFLHSISGPESLRPFEKTFDKKYIEPYIKSISLEEYRKACSGVVDTLVWFYPDRSSWVHVVKFWMDGVRMKHLSEIETPHRILLMNKTEIVNMFTPLKEKKCIALCFLFRNVAETTERKAIATNLVYAKEIQDLARNAVKEIGTKPENMLSIHWRWGELSCAKWLSPDPRPDDDFCWGTSRVRSVLAVYLFLTVLHTSLVRHHHHHHHHRHHHPHPPPPPYPRS